MIALATWTVPAAFAQLAPTAGARVHDRVRISTTTVGSARPEGFVLVVSPESRVVVDTGSVRDRIAGPQLFRASVPAAHIGAIEISGGRGRGSWALRGAPEAVRSPGL